MEVREIRYHPGTDFVRRRDINDIYLPMKIRLLIAQIDEINDLEYKAYISELDKVKALNLKYTSHILEYFDHRVNRIVDTYGKLKFISSMRQYLYHRGRLIANTPKTVNSLIQALESHILQIKSDWKVLLNNVKETKILYANIKWEISCNNSI